MCVCVFGSHVHSGGDLVKQGEGGGTQPETPGVGRESLQFVGHSRDHSGLHVWSTL